MAFSTLPFTMAHRGLNSTRARTKAHEPERSGRKFRKRGGAAEAALSPHQSPVASSVVGVFFSFPAPLERASGRPEGGKVRKSGRNTTGVCGPVSGALERRRGDIAAKCNRRKKMVIAAPRIMNI